MATVNPTVKEAFLEGFQNLYTITLVNDTNGSAGVPQYNSPGARVPVTFDTAGTTVGSDASIDLTTGEITLAADIVWSITVQADQEGPGATGSYQFVNEGNNEPEGLAQPIGHPLIFTVMPTVESVYQIIATAPAGGVWSYPSRLSNVTIVITAISGYTA